MNQGKLDQRVRLYRRIQVPDGGGGFADEWDFIAECWANVKALSGRERMMAEQLEAPRNYRVTVRRRAGLIEADRIVWRDRNLNVRFIADEGTRQQYLPIDCEMGVAPP